MGEKKGKKYTRREFLKQSGIGGLRVATYGALGGALGKVYGYVILNPLRYLSERVDDTARLTHELNQRVENSEGAAGYLKNPNNFIDRYVVGSWKKVSGRTDEDQRKERVRIGVEEPNPEDNEISRRGFFRSFFDYISKNPVKSGVGAGAGYGALKSVGKARTGYQKAKTRHEINDLKEEQENLRKDVEDLKKKKKDLEGITEDGGRVMVLIGFTGIILSALIGTINLTGFVILSSVRTSLSISSLIVFFISFIILFLGSKKYKSKGGVKK
jgi:hypothetical protein